MSPLERSVRTPDALTRMPSIMPRACATTATICMEEAALPPSVNIKIGWSMLKASARTATFSATIQRRRSKNSKLPRGRTRKRNQPDDIRSNITIIK